MSVFERGKQHLIKLYENSLEKEFQGIYKIFLFTKVFVFQWGLKVSVFATKKKKSKVLKSLTTMF